MAYDSVRRRRFAEFWISSASENFSALSQIDSIRCFHTPARASSCSHAATVSDPTSSQGRLDAAVVALYALGNPPGGFLSFMPQMAIFNDENAQAKIETILFRCEMAFREFNGNVPTVEIGRQLAPLTRLPILADDAAADEFVATGTLSLAAPDGPVAPSALVTVTLNGTEIHWSEVNSASRHLGGAMTQFGYVFGPIKIEEGRVDAT